MQGAYSAANITCDTDVFRVYGKILFNYLVNHPASTERYEEQFE